MKFILKIRSRFAQLASQKWIYKPVFIVIGLVSLLWFLFRVVPKPSRASYPCMQTAFPIASSFVLWFVGSFGSIALLRKIPMAFQNKNYVKVVGFSFVGALLLVLATTFNRESITFANSLSKNVDVIDPVKKDYGNTIDQLKVKVGIVKSDKALASDIQYPEILSMVREAIRLSGGFGNLIKDGKTVMLKPNIVNDFPNRAIEVNGATTDYRVVQAVAEIVRELNPHGKIIVAEGSAGDKPTMEIFSRLKYTTIPNVDRVMGFDGTSGEYRDYASDSLVAVNLPDALSDYPDEIKPNKTRAIYYNKRYFQADVLISIPVLKNHSTAGITGAVKNVTIGCTPINLYADKDNAKPFLRSVVIPHDVPTLSKWMHDYYIGRPVDFVIIDGLQGGSSGPGVGSNDLAKIKRNQQNMRLILAGKDAVATDAVAGLIMGHDPQRAQYLVSIHNDGYGIVDPALIDVVGVKVNTVRKYFGYDGVNTTVTTPFDKFESTDYEISGIIKNNVLSLSVTNPIDLARMTIKVDDQLIYKYVVGGFDDISLNLDGINVKNGKIDVLFEDRYLNPLNKQFTAKIKTSVPSVNSQDAIVIYPNPASDKLNLKLNDGSVGQYRIQIIDVSGKTVMTTMHNSTLNGLEINLGLEKINSGNYIFRLIGADGKVKQAKFTKI